MRIATIYVISVCLAIIVFSLGIMFAEHYGPRVELVVKPPEYPVIIPAMIQFGHMPFVYFDDKNYKAYVWNGNDTTVRCISFIDHGNGRYELGPTHEVECLMPIDRYSPKGLKR